MLYINIGSFPKPVDFVLPRCLQTQTNRSSFGCVHCFNAAGAAVADVAFGTFIYFRLFRLEYVLNHVFIKLIQNCILHEFTRQRNLFLFMDSCERSFIIVGFGLACTFTFEAYILWLLLLLLLLPCSGFRYVFFFMVYYGFFAP